MVPGEDAAQLRKRYRPAAIKGDLDSIRPKIRQFYEGLGVHIIDNSDDQDTTDLQKCLAWVREQQGEELSKCQVVVAGGATALPMERCLLCLMLLGPADAPYLLQRARRCLSCLCMLWLSSPELQTLMRLQAAAAGRCHVWSCR